MNPSDDDEKCAVAVLVKHLFQNHKTHHHRHHYNEDRMLIADIQTNEHQNEEQSERFACSVKRKIPSFEGSSRSLVL